MKGCSRGVYVSVPAGATRTETVDKFELSCEDGDWWRPSGMEGKSVSGPHIGELDKNRAAVKGCGLSGVILTCMPMAPFGFGA